MSERINFEQPGHFEEFPIKSLSFVGGEHLCFLGSGRNEEDQYTHMIVASFLQKHTQYVSLLAGGYVALHEYFAQNLSYLQDHNPRFCIVCAPHYVTNNASQSNTKSGQSFLISKRSAINVFISFD